MAFIFAHAPEKKSLTYFNTDITLSKDFFRREIHTMGGLF